jgi:sterol desaturase/sphingolipid hydroxylase (fatty acid hydroxylase superfamily)
MGMDGFLDALLQVVLVGVTLLWPALFFTLLAHVLDESSEKKYKNFTLAQNHFRGWSGEMRSEIYYPFVNGMLTVIPSAFLLSTFLLPILIEPYFPKHVLLPFFAEQPLWLQLPLGLVAIDFVLYVRHRFVHHFCWPFHAVHHRTKEIGWLTAHRLHPIDALVMGMINVAMFYLIGFEGEVMLYASSIVMFLNYFNHSNICLDYGSPLRYIFVSPNMHRWHHATTKEAKNKNFCIVFAWIDVLFGTFYCPKNTLPKVYGIQGEKVPEPKKMSFLWDFVYPFRKIYYDRKKKS